MNEQKSQPSTSGAGLLFRLFCSINGFILEIEENNQIFAPLTSGAGLLFTLFSITCRFALQKHIIINKSFTARLLEMGYFFVFQCKLFCFGKALKKTRDHRPRLFELGYFLVCFPINIFLLWKYDWKWLKICTPDFWRWLTCWVCSPVWIDLLWKYNELRLKYVYLYVIERSENVVYMYQPWLWMNKNIV